MLAILLRFLLVMNNHSLFNSVMLHSLLHCRYIESSWSLDIIMIYVNQRFNCMLSPPLPPPPQCCSGIGIVNAVEVVNAFPEEDGLHKFREWIESPDPSILGKADLQARPRSRKKGSKAVDIDGSCSNSNNEGASFLDDVDNEKQIFMDKHVIKFSSPFFYSLCLN